MSAEEAIARAKAIAARLAGTGASAALAPEPSTGGAVNVNAVADAALAAAFGQASDSSSGKRKRWSDDSGKFCLQPKMCTSGAQFTHILYYWISSDNFFIIQDLEIIHHLLSLMMH